MNVVITTRPRAEMRYETCGDWQYDQATETLHIDVVRYNDARYEMLIAHHELTEALLCLFNGVSTEEVDRFDLNFTGEGEPGDAWQAPYYEQHQIATGFERIMARELKVYWQVYERIIDETFTNLNTEEPSNGNETTLG
jgi:hypothetical protein